MIPVHTDGQGKQYVLIASGPCQAQRVYLKADGTYPCAGERGDTFTSCSCGFPHSPCRRLANANKEKK